ncbi:tetratricopeptide repeat protein [Azospirillum argentinense]|uniref:tetratricopeptide repeat protein n=1 Tax=Azospirillum argentinense TaxID=2970906 RepID=UPI003566AEED
MDFLRAGAAALQRGDRAGAERRIVRALALVPGHGECWNILGVLAVSAGDPAGGEARFRRASACVPENPVYARSQAECLKRQGRADQAAALLAGAVRRGVLSPDLACDLGDLRLGARDGAAAVALYRLALALAPGHARSLNNLAEALGKAERLDAAADASPGWRCGGAAGGVAAGRGAGGAAPGRRARPVHGRALGQPGLRRTGTARGRPGRGRLRPRLAPVAGDGHGASRAGDAADAHRAPARRGGRLRSAAEPAHLPAIADLQPADVGRSG